MPELIQPLSPPLLTRFQKGVIILTLIITAIGIFRNYIPSKYSFAASSISPVVTESAHASPTFINIPSLSLGLPLFQTNDQVSKVTLSKPVLHPTSSAYPGEHGNIILMGGNSEESLGKILELPKGESIMVVTKDGIGHEYIVDELLLVNPGDKRISEETPLETLTLVTPAGFFGTKRFVVKAVPATL